MTDSPKRFIMCSEQRIMCASNVTVLLADDHPRVLGSVRRLLETDYTVVGAVSDGAALISAARELRPDIVVTDLVMEPVNGLQAAAVILATCDPRPIVIMLTAVWDVETAQEAFAAGIQGYVSKTRVAEDLIPAIESVLTGATFLSPGAD